MCTLYRSGPSRLAVHAVAVLLTALAIASEAGAQTPAQMEYERQQREYRQQLEQQRQEQLRQQQLMNENARRQQQEQSRFNAPVGQSPTPGQATTPQMGSPQPGGQALEQARQTWLKRPPLPPDRNPLLGKWQRPSTGAQNSSDPFASLAALAKGGMCEMLFGGGTFEFRPTKLVGFDKRTSEQELDQVEYRGGGKQVVVLPKTTVRLMVFDFDGPDRINWAGQNCVLVRVGPAPSSASGLSSAQPPNAGADATAATATAKWVQRVNLEAFGGTSIYSDSVTTHRAGDVVQIWELWDFKSAQVIGGKRVLSVKNQFEYDCKGARGRMLFTAGFSEHMGKGKVVDSGNGPMTWQPVAGTYVEELWKVACGKK